MLLESYTKAEGDKSLEGAGGKGLVVVEDLSNDLKELMKEGPVEGKGKSKQAIKEQGRSMSWTRMRSSMRRLNWP